MFLAVLANVTEMVALYPTYTHKVICHFVGCASLNAEKKKVN